MKQFNRITPDGTRDRLFGECAQRRRLEHPLRALFESRGYREAATPMLEYYDVFDTSRAYFPQESIYKLVDHTGHLLVLRPDCTIPIARLTGSRLKNENGLLRIYYQQSVFRYPEGHSGLSGEIAQMGVETIGGGLPICDVEMVELAARSLRVCCGENFQIELGHIGYFKALVESLGVDSDTAEQIRELIEHKNFPALDSLLEPFGEAPAVRALRRLPALFGGPSVLEEARALFRSEDADRALDFLAYIYRSLASLALESHLMLDLGLVHQADYYTGVIFRGYTGGVGEAVLSGGRYDGLLGEFGPPRPATGFGVNMDLLCERAGDDAAIAPPAAAVAVDEASDIATAFALLERLRAQSFEAELLPVDCVTSLPDLSRYDRAFVVECAQTREVRS
ncbi:MAG: ATP phosphoribosyltransferase regulatory subunit [Oscillospiraceae bacterium]